MRRLSDTFASVGYISTIALLCGSPAAAKPVPSTFSIAGVHIGQKPADVLSALRREGYRIAKVSQSDSFRQRLSDARNAELRQPYDKARATDVGNVIAAQADQRIRVNFDDDATGSRVVSAIYYEASSVVHPFDRVRATMIGRYGQPEAEDGTGPVWCVNDAPDVCKAHGVLGDRLKVGHDHRGFDHSAELTTIELVAGIDSSKSWQDGFRAALARLLKSRDAF
ncbi:hypothetical protein [Sphingomonas sp.]|uniref:hypothetical protein n=1 Tax=Sphingomonas sp. TaxID=28214 RepID=UPI0025F127AB|nr:hypothetical protein [Sphingomonas sp.]